MPSERWATIDHREVDPSDQHFMQEKSVQKYPLGARLSLVDGRTFRYAENGAVALTAGLVNSSPDTGAEREDTLTVIASAGARSLTYTAVGTITANQYADALLCVVDGVGQGLQYKIKNHLAIAAAATGVINLYDPIVTALDLTTDVMLVKSLYKSVVVAPDQIVIPTGVAPIPVQASFFFWNQTRGIAPVLAEDSTGDAATERICTLGTSSGVLTTAGGAPGAPIIGRVMFAGLDHVSGDYPPIFLTIE